MNDLAAALEFNLIIEELEQFFPYPEKVQTLRIKNTILQIHDTVEGTMNLRIVQYYFGIKRDSNDKVNHFWINILSNLTFAKKIELVSLIRSLSKDAIKILRNINDIRNDVAHFQRISKRREKYLSYEGKNIYKNIEALRKFHVDVEKLLSEL